MKMGVTHILLRKYILAVVFGFIASLVLLYKLYYMGVSSFVYSLGVGLLIIYILIMLFSDRIKLNDEQIVFPYKISIQIRFRRRDDSSIYESKKCEKKSLDSENGKRS